MPEGEVPFQLPLPLPAQAHTAGDSHLYPDVHALHETESLSDQVPQQLCCIGEQKEVSLRFQPHTRPEKGLSAKGVLKHSHSFKKQIYIVYLLRCGRLRCAGLVFGDQGHRPGDGS